MKLLADYIFDEHLRYEAHELVYTGSNEPAVFRGIMAAGVLGALLSVIDEGEARGITLDTDEGRDDFFRRYEKEVLADNGGLFETEVQALNDAYLECTGDPDLLLRLCRNDRLLDLALGLTVEYMQRLVKEQVFEHIYDLHQWHEPFAQWLFDAGFIETRRQRLLNIDWAEPFEVYALSEEMNKDQSDEPTFVFAGLSAEQVLNGYWNWLWDTVQKEAGLYPDSKVRLAELKKTILENELDYDFLKPQMKDFTPEQINLFRSWMNQWADFVQTQIQPATDKRQKKEEQIFFPDEVLQCPTEDMPEKYAATREYVKERSKYDEKFRKFAINESFAKLCRQLTLLFGWFVEPSSLRKSMLRKPKRRTKKYV